MRTTWLAMVLFAAGCATPPPVHEYLVHAVGASGDASPGTAERALWLRSFHVRGFLDRSGVAYEEGEVLAGEYRYHQWGEPLGEMVSRVLTDGLRSSGRFLAVLGPRERGESPCVIDVDLLGFHERDDLDGVVRAVVELGIDRRESEDGPPRRRCFRREAEVQGREVADVVRTLQELLREVCDEVVVFLAAPRS